MLRMLEVISTILHVRQMYQVRLKGLAQTICVISENPAANSWKADFLLQNVLPKLLSVQCLEDRFDCILNTK